MKGLYTNDLNGIPKYFFLYMYCLQLDIFCEKVYLIEVLLTNRLEL